MEFACRASSVSKCEMSKSFSRDRVGSHARQIVTWPVPPSLDMYTPDFDNVRARFAALRSSTFAALGCNCWGRKTAEVRSVGQEHKEAQRRTLDAWAALS